MPAAGQMNTSHTTVSLCSLTQLLTAEAIPNQFKTMSCADIEDLRNLWLTNWYYKQKEASHLLMIDADMHFSPFMVWDMLQFGRPVVGCYYSKRQFPISVVGKSFDDDSIDKVVDGHLPVKGVGAGVLLIKRTVIDTMIEKMPDIIDKSDMHPVITTQREYELPHLLRPFSKIVFPNGGRLSEDLSFCHRWRECGGEVWANVRHPIGHHGLFGFNIRYEEFLEDQAKEEKVAA